MLVLNLLCFIASAIIFSKTNVYTYANFFLTSQAKTWKWEFRSWNLMVDILIICLLPSILLFFGQRHLVNKKIIVHVFETR